MWNWPLISLVAFIGFLISCRSWTWRGKVMAGICFVGLLVTTVFGITRTPDHDFIVKECGYYASQGARIGVELKKANASGKVALIVFDHLKDTDEFKAFQSILKRFGECDEITVHTVTLAHPQAVSGADRLDMAEFCRVLDGIAADRSVVSLVGLPRDLRQVRSLRRGNGCEKPLIAICEDPVPVRILKENLIDGAVVQKRDAFFNTEPVSDYLTAFNERYLYVEAN